MKSLKYILTIGLLFGLTLPSYSQWFMERNEVDEFTGERLLQTVRSEITNEQGNMIYPFFHITRINGQTQLVIEFRVSILAGEFIHENNDEIAFLIDGKRKVLQSTKTELSTESPAAITTKYITLQNIDLKDFTNAQNIRMRIGKQYYTLSRDGVRLFTQFYNIITKS